MPLCAVREHVLLSNGQSNGGSSLRSCSTRSTSVRALWTNISLDAAGLHPHILRLISLICSLATYIGTYLHGFMTSLSSTLLLSTVTFSDKIITHCNAVSLPIESMPSVMRG